ncbi:MAG TPA: hypothetical protein DCG85_07490 [Lachnospiraceae bacterium]|nr:hypothetical protein [Lachnospiraceae bacterium]
MENDNKKEYIKRLMLCLCYALFYTFCLYKNHRGITYPFFSAATIISYVLVSKAMGKKIKKLSYAFMIFIMLLSVHVFTTTSEPLIVFDKIFVFALFFIMFLYDNYDDSSWDVSRYFLAIMATIFSSIQFAFDPIIDGRNIKIDMKIKAETANAAETGEKAGKGTIGYVFLGLAIAVPILCIVLPLLASSDAVFSNFLSSIYDLEFDADVVGVLFTILFIFVAGYALIKRLYHKEYWLNEPVTDKRVHTPVVAITISAVLLVFYVIYSGIQIIYLFLGFGTLPDDYTYAEYAHEGFFQLVFVCLINLILVLICRKYSKDDKVLKVMLTCISACTYVMLFSSAYRMILYISVYGLTFLRVYVIWALIVIALIMGGTVAFVFSDRVPFVKYAIFTVIFTWTIFAFSYPDKYIASYNIEHGLDVRYARNHLSSDAAPVIAKNKDMFIINPDGDKNEKLWDIYVTECEFKYGPDGNLNDIRKFNISEYNALRALGIK